MVGPLAYVISPQPWNGFQVSKHHYARALAQRGWRVIFVDPPTDLGAAKQIEIGETEVAGISSLKYQTFFPYWLKFRSRLLFDLLMRRQAQQIVHAAGKPDLVWDFDNAYQFRDLRSFGADLTLFHLVDDVSRHDLGDKRADHFFYLHRSFCDHAGGTPDTDHEIGHGIGNVHVELARMAVDLPRKHGPPHVGFVGNLAAPWLDWDAVAEMVRRHPEARFTLWGPLPTVGIGPVLQALIDHPATQFPGLTQPKLIVEVAETVDVWLLPFRTEKLLGGPLNSHKVLEYLATGRAVVMNWLEAYDGNPLVHMPPRKGSAGLPDLLDRVLACLDKVNAPDMAARRRTYALEHSYNGHIDHIFDLTGLSDLTKLRDAT